MRTTLFPVFVLLLLSCTRTNNYFENFMFGQNGFLEISIQNCDSITYFELYSRQTFPNSVNKHIVRINQDTSFIISLPSNINDFSFFSIGGKEIQNIYLIPEDTLHIKLNLDNNLDKEERIHYKGSSAEICYYYQAKMNNWKKTKGYDYYFDSTISITSFVEKVDKNQDNDLAFLYKYAHNNHLPEWFIDIEKSSIIYLVATMKLGIIQTHRMLYDNTFYPPEDYYSFLDNIDILNPAAYLSSQYYGFLRAYYSMNYIPGEPGFNNTYQANQEILQEFEIKKNDLNPKVRDIFLGFMLSGLYQDNFLTQTNFTQSDSLFEFSKSLFSDQAMMKIVEDYRDTQFNKLQNQVTLHPGDEAPGFYLTDLEGKYYKLHDFKGKVLYVNFWATYCAPCIASIPNKNRLVEEFLNQPFELINICLDNKSEKWLTIIKENEFGGTHLICKGDWENTLRNRYLIQTVPHYALIDREGKVICNNCEKPEHIADQLRKILK